MNQGIFLRDSIWVFKVSRLVSSSSNLSRTFWIRGQRQGMTGISVFQIIGKEMGAKLFEQAALLVPQVGDIQFQLTDELFWILHGRLLP